MNHKWTEIIRNLHAQQLLTRLGCEYATRVVSSPPSRNPANGSRRNLIVDFASRKMGHTVPVESATLEAAHAQILECASNCVGYWSQPEPISIRCTARDGVVRSIWITFDFLVISNDGVEIHECKPEAECVRLSELHPGRYALGENGWTGPEVETALQVYGIRYRIITEKDVPPTLVRNIAILNEASKSEYSCKSALTQIRDQIKSEGSATLLASVLGAVGNGFSKNDVYIAIARRDVFTLLAQMLLVDTATTRLFLSEQDAEVYRLQHCIPIPPAGQPVVIRTGDNLFWQGAEHRVCNASKHHVYLQQKSGDPIKFTREFLFSLIESGEIVLPPTTDSWRNVVERNGDALVKQLTSDTYNTAVKKLQFLALLKTTPAAKSEDFGLPSVSTRTIQRWQRQAAEGESRFGSAVLGLIEKRRPGRPRSTQSVRGQQIASEVADELYFSEVRRTMRYCWIEYKGRCLKEGLTPLGPKAFCRHIRKMRTAHDTTKARKGERASYALSSGPSAGENWLTAGGDYPFKLGQMDGKYMDIEVVDDETGENLGRPSITLIVLPHYSAAPIGRALMFEKANCRASTMALRDCFRRIGRLPRFLLIDNGKEFNNTVFDKLLALFGVTKVNRPPNRPRFSAEIESLFRTIDRELVHNLRGNTQASRDGREMTAETNPKRQAVWTLSALVKVLDEYLFELYWDAPSAALGTTPRNAIARDVARAPEPQELMLPPKLVDFAFLPQVEEQTRQVQPGRGVWVEGWYYWNDRFADPKIEKQDVEVRYDPYDIFSVYVLWNGEPIKCTAKHAPELRNVTAENRSWLCLAQRQLRKLHPKKREEIHGTKLAALARKARANEEIAQKTRDDVRDHDESSKNSAPQKPMVPTVDLSHLLDAA